MMTLMVMMVMVMLMMVMMVVMIVMMMMVNSRDLVHQYLAQRRYLINVLNECIMIIANTALALI